MKRIAFGCDHVGFILKEDILAHLRGRGVEVVDKAPGRPNAPITRIMPALLRPPCSTVRLMAAS